MSPTAPAGIPVGLSLRCQSMTRRCIGNASGARNLMSVAGAARRANCHRWASRGYQSTMSLSPSPSCECSAILVAQWTRPESPAIHRPEPETRIEAIDGHIRVRGKSNDNAGWPTGPLDPPFHAPCRARSPRYAGSRAACPRRAAAVLHRDTRRHSRQMGAADATQRCRHRARRNARAGRCHRWVPTGPRAVCQPLATYTCPAPRALPSAAPARRTPFWQGPALAAASGRHYQRSVC